MTPLDLYFYEYLKSFVYESPVMSEEDIIGKIVEASARITVIVGIFERVKQMGGILFRTVMYCIYIT